MKNPALKWWIAARLASSSAWKRGPSKLVLMEAIFWLGIFAPLYSYIGYPMILALLRLVIHREVKKQPYEPHISLLIPAYKEAEMIEQKIHNSLALDYPADKLEILIACDGPKDGTVEIAKRAAQGTRIRILDYPKNRGKILTLNDAVRECTSEILVFSDAAAMLYRDSVRKLVENFADPEVGAVSGKYTVIKADEVDIGKSEDFYWKYETYLKTQESQLSSTLGAHGHLHAIRKSLYPFPSPEIINDDYVIPVSVLAKQYRAVYEPQAIVYEEAREMTGFGRRIRIMAGNIQQIGEITGLFSPFQALPLFFFLSHKVSRLVVPFGMVAALVANLFLLDSSLYFALFCGQAAFYVLALVGTFAKLTPKLLMLPYYFSMINTAVFFGVYHALTDRRRMAWK
jgi:cellulose synthase/poly-beta-1,6-N-acetylglucosamine synthase-like glycosyltransferase